jgi:hypothetical protein
MDLAPAPSLACSVTRAGARRQSFAERPDHPTFWTVSLRGTAMTISSKRGKTAWNWLIADPDRIGSIGTTRCLGGLY